MVPVRVGSGEVVAEVQRQGAMVTAEFRLKDRVVAPLYRAPWSQYRDDPLLDRLRGDFVCVPFGIAPATMADFPAGWRALDPGSPGPAHGAPANSEWQVVHCGDDHAEFSWGGDTEADVAGLRRIVRTLPGELVIEDEISVRHPTRLPLGLHPILRLPTEPGGAQLIAPGSEAIVTLPVPTDASSILVPNQEFSDLAAAPTLDRTAIDLTRLPLGVDTEELVLLCHVAEPELVLENLVEGYRVRMWWESEHLKHLLLWVSNRGRKAEPWRGRNLCLGVEPVTSAFDLGPAISSGMNPLADRGFATAVEVVPGQAIRLRHGFSVTELN